MACKKNMVFLQIILLAFFSYSIKAQEITSAQQELLNQLPADQRDSILQKMNKANQIQDEIDEVFESESTLIERRKKKVKIQKMKSVRIVSLAMNFLNILHLHLYKQALLRFPLIMFSDLAINWK